MNDQYRGMGFSNLLEIKDNKINELGLGYRINSSSFKQKEI